MLFIFLGTPNDDLQEVNILFRIEMDPLISSTLHVIFREIGLDGSNEEELLFSMHSVFLISRINQTAECLWEVCLKSASDDDLQLKSLTTYIRSEVQQAHGWYRMGLLLQLMGKFEEALDLYESLLERFSSENPNSFEMSDILSDNIAQVHHDLGNYSYGLIYSEHSLQRCQNTFPPNYLMSARIYDK